MDTTRATLIKELTIIRDLVLENPDTLREEKAAQMDVLMKRFVQVKKKIQLHERYASLRKKFLENSAIYKNKVKVLHEIKEDLELSRKEFEKTNLINFSNNPNVPAAEILLYACKISNFIQAPPNYTTDECLFPWSFGMNKVELADIENSGLYYMYKNNSIYEICPPPEIVYVNMSEKNIEMFRPEEDLVFSMVVRGHLYMRPQVNPGESFVYTLNGSIPNKFERDEQQQDLITISSDCEVKLRSFKPGLIDSPILHYKITIKGKQEEDAGGLVNMERPEYSLQSEDNEDGVSDKESSNMDELFSGAMFSSFHDPGLLATPSNMQNDSEHHTPFN